MLREPSNNKLCKIIEQMNGSARFRYKPVVAEMGTDGHLLKDVNIMQSSHIYDLNAEPLNDKDQLHADLKNSKGHISSKPCFRSLYMTTDPQSNSSSSSQQGVNHGLTSAYEFDRVSELILMGCMRCHIYVMVCDDNPKCPKCRKSDCLLDVFRENSVKRDNIM